MKADETANRNGATNKNAQQQQERLANRQRGEPLALASEERISADHKRALPSWSGSVLASWLPNG
jgi:hypothetical protein